MKLFSEKLIPFYAWLTNAAETALTNTARKYCLFDAEELDWRYFRDVLFNRDTANETFVRLYEEPSLQKRQPLVTLHKDIDATYSLHRSFAARHKTRLQIYRDDLANKGVRLSSSVGTTEALVDSLTEKIGGAS